MDERGVEWQTDEQLSREIACDEKCLTIDDSRESVRSDGRVSQLNLTHML